MLFSISRLKCLTDEMLMGIIILSSRETARLVIGYHETFKNFFRWKGLRRFKEPTHQNEYSRICGDHFETSWFIKCPGSSRKNLRSGTVPTKFCFVQEKAVRKPLVERKPVEEKWSLRLEIFRTWCWHAYGNSHSQHNSRKLGRRGRI